MTEKEWVERSTNPSRMLDFLRDKTTPRKFRLCAVAFSRGVFHLAAEVHREEVEAAITVAERFAEVTATQAELVGVYESAIPWDSENSAAIQACNPDPRLAARNSLRQATAVVLNDWSRRHPGAWMRSEESRPAKTSQSAIQIAIIRDIFGNVRFAA